MRSLRQGLVLVVLYVLLPVAGRASEVRQDRVHPDVLARVSELRTVGIVVPEVKVYELTASNEPVFRLDWSEQGKEAVTRSLEAALRARGLEPKRLQPTTAQDQEQLREVRLLYQAVVAAVVQATFVNRFPAKVNRFEYSVGPVGALLERQQVDAVVFASGSGAVSSGGRKAVQTLSAIFAGVSSSGVDRLMVGVIDRRGDLLFFGTLASTDHDLRDSGSADEFVQKLARDLPAVSR
jgi:hypothetical protein